MEVHARLQVGGHLVLPGQCHARQPCKIERVYHDMIQDKTTVEQSAVLLPQGT